MTPIRTAARVAAIVLGLAMLAAACGDSSGNDAVATTVGPGPDDQSETCTDAAGLAERLRPAVAYDYDPTESPAALAANSEIVLRADGIRSITLAGDWITFELDGIRVVADQREGEIESPTVIAMNTSGAELMGGAIPTLADLAGVEVLAFADSWAEAPGGLAVRIEGFWIGCGATGPAASVIVTPTGEPWAIGSLDDLERALSEPDGVGEVTVDVSEGDGWRLVDARPGFGQSHEVAIATTPRGLERAFAERWFRDTPDVSFDSEVVIFLAPAVSSSCPGIIFNGLEITPDRVFGQFDPAPPPGDGCNADANPISFVFVVDRAALPSQFSLSVEEDVVCGGCEFAELSVDLDDEAGLEELLWSANALDLVKAGTAPAGDTFNVVRFDGDSALLFSAGDWSEEPTWFQGYEGSAPSLIEGFVAACEGEQCEECEGSACQALVPLGKVCSRPYESIPFVDQTFTIVFDGLDCIIEAADGRAPR